VPRKYDSMEERIIANTVLSTTNFYNGTPCWEWTGAYVINRNGQRYGKINTRYKRGPRKGKIKTEYVHRVVLRVFKGRVLSKRSVGRHLCNNTICGNPEHLVGGTQRSNVRQCVREGRHHTPFRKSSATVTAAELHG